MEIDYSNHADYSYYLFNREEKNLSALLYSLLMDTENLKKIVGVTPSKIKSGLENSEVYFEYALLKDYWSHFCKDNHEFALDYLINHLELNRLADILKVKTPLELNDFFKVTGVKKNIKLLNSPSTWGTPEENKVLTPMEKKNIIKFKWMYNLKPTIVIEIDENNVIFINPSIKSTENIYAAIIDKKRFDIGEIQLQKEMFEKHLGYANVHPIAITAKKPTKTVKGVTYLTWQEIFKICSTPPNMLPKQKDWILRQSKGLDYFL